MARKDDQPRQPLDDWDKTLRQARARRRALPAQPGDKPQPRKGRTP